MSFTARLVLAASILSASLQTVAATVAVVPPGQSVEGATQGTWSSRWWQ